MFIPAWIACSVQLTQTNKQNHFVLIDLNLRNRCCHIRDSGNFDETSNFLVQRCAQLADKLLHTPANSPPWPVSKPNDVLKQINNSDCSLHVLSFLAKEFFGTEDSNSTVSRWRQMLPALLLTTWKQASPPFLKIESARQPQPVCPPKPSHPAKQGGSSPVKNRLNARNINDYSGLLLNKASYFQAILNHTKKYEIRSVKRLHLPPKVVFPPDQNLRDSRQWTKI